MCLFKSHKLPKIAWKPITCYKVVIPCCCGTCFYTPYTNTLCDLNEPIKHSVKSIGLFKRTLKGEVVHAYTNYHCASIEHSSFNNETAKIVECVIPRFTIYWLGGWGEIGARRLIPLKML